MTKELNEPKPIRFRQGKGFYRHVFGGEGFIACLIELLKNARDWKAAAIYILTHVRAELKIFDNGHGMNEGNRNGFCSVADPDVARGPDSSGLFNTGTKKMLYSHCHSVKVITAPKDDPDFVYIFTFTADEYEELARKEESLVPEKLPKDDSSWPYGRSDSYGARFGTMLIYTFADPRSQKLTRAKRLAEELSARLPIKLLSKVYVDGERLPDKEIIGGVFEVTDSTIPELGDVTLEVYRPRKKRSEEALRLTGAEIGEATFSNLVRRIGDMRGLVPHVYTLNEVCGVVSAQFFGKYANEDRKTIKPDIVDDPRLVLLLKLLKKYEPLILKTLGIRLQRVDVDDQEAETEDLDAVASMYNNRYSEGVPRPPGHGPGPGPTRTPGTKKKSLLHLPNKEELEVGEVMEMQLRFRGTLKGKYTLQDIDWDFSRACGKVSITSDGLKLTATTEGKGLIVGDLIGTPYDARASYRVVRERRLRLSIGAYVEVEQGASLVIVAENSDKLGGALEWNFVEGSVGDLTPDGEKATYVATETGSARIEAFDATDPSVKAESEILVIKPVDRRKLFCVRGVWFVLQTFDSDLKTYKRPVTMELGTADRHKIIANRMAPAYMEAKKRGFLRELIRDAIALEFARFARFDLEEMDLNDFDGRDLPVVVASIQTEGYVILEEILASLKNGGH